MAFHCPICEKSVDDPTGEASNVRSFFPFCSERCKLIDLGRWLDGKYQIPAVEDEAEDAADTSPNIPEM